MSRTNLVINGTEYNVDIVEMSGGAATVTVNGVTYQVELPQGAAVPVAAAPAPVPAPRPGPTAPAKAPAAPKPAPAPAAPAAPAAAVPAGGEVISAPMPGHILNVLVAAGDVVEVGDTLLVMEAMKMENEIKSHIAGTIAEIKVSMGQDVGVGEVLVVIGG